GGQARDALQLALTVGEQLFTARRGGFGPLLQFDEAGVPFSEVTFELVGRCDAIREGARAVGEGGLEPDDLLLAFARLFLSVRDERVRLLARLEVCFLLERLGFAFCLGAELTRVFFGRPTTSAAMRLRLAIQ